MGGKLKMRKSSATIIAFAIFLVLLPSAFAASMLEITDVTVKVDDDKQVADENGGNIKIVPDSTLTIKVTVENLFDNSVEDGKIEDIVVNGLLEEIDDGDDFEEEASEFDLSPGRDKTVTLTFKIPLRLPSDETYQLVLTVEGEDQNNTDHTDEIQFDIDVDKEKHELRFLRKEILPTKLSCERSAVLYVDVINTGEEDQTAQIVIMSPSLNYNKQEEVELSGDVDDDSNEYHSTYNLDLSNALPGVYPFVIKAVYRNGRQTLQDSVSVEVVQCGTTAPATKPVQPVVEEDEEDTTPVVVTKPKTESETVVITTPQPSPYVRPTTAVATPKTSYTQKGWFSENQWLAIILLTNLVLVIAGIVVIVAILKRRQ